MSDNAARQDSGHTSVLLHESIDLLDIRKGSIVLDGTLGSGGHSEEILKRLNGEVRIIGLDMDTDAIKRSEARLRPYANSITFIQENFRNLDRALDSAGIESVNAILLDIGLSSNQLEDSGRGFSFQKDEPLAMTFKKSPEPEDITAETIVNEWKEENVATILWGYGQERYSRKIAKAIIEARQGKPIRTTRELVDVILAATPKAYHHSGIHPATRTFQALRIAVNDELQALEEGLQKGFARLLPHGRIAVISFHSLEDKIVKNFFRERAKEGMAELITKKPVTSSPEELETNRRARSAKLRVLKKV